MKLTASIDLATLRATVAEKIDAAFAARALSIDRNWLLHAVKANLIACGSVEHIRAEAAATGMMVDSLAQLILTKSKATTALLADLEAERQRTKHRLLSLQTEQEIRNLVP